MKLAACACSLAGRRYSSECHRSKHFYAPFPPARFPSNGILGGIYSKTRYEPCCITGDENALQQYLGTRLSLFFCRGSFHLPHTTRITDRAAPRRTTTRDA